MIIWWFFTNYGMQLVYLVAGLWLGNGLRKAIFRPRIKLLGFSETKAGTFVETERQQLLPPWLTVKESWHLVKDRHFRRDYSSFTADDFARESDGVYLSAARFGWFADLNWQLSRLILAKKAREKETEELLKEERPRAQA